MKLLLALIIMMHVSVTNAAPPLEGRWKSNKALTIPTFNVKDQVSEKTRDRFFNLFGKMIVTWTDNESLAYWPPSCEFGERSSRSKYRVEIETQDKLIIASTDAETGEVEKSTLHFISPDRYYIEFDFPPGFYMRGAREYFDRMDDPET